MAARKFYENVQHLIPKLTFLSGKIAIAGTGAPSFTLATDFNGAATIARTGAGAYTLTLADAYQGDISCFLTVRNSTAGVGFVQVKAIDLVTAKTVTFFTVVATVDGGTMDLNGFAAGDLPSGTIIDVLIMARDSTVLL